LRTATDLARLLLDRTDHVEAREVLKPVCEWFSEGKDTADYVAARTLLADIEERHSRTGELRIAGESAETSSLCD